MDTLAKIEQLRELAAADPGDYVTFFMLGAEEIHAGFYRDAVQSLERCLALKPTHTAGVRMLGDAWRHLGDAAKAREYYERAIEVAEQTGDLQVAREARAFLRKMAA